LYTPIPSALVRSSSDEWHPPPSIQPTPACPAVPTSPTSAQNPAPPPLSVPVGDAGSTALWPAADFERYSTHRRPDAAKPLVQRLGSSPIAQMVQPTRLGVVAGVETLRGGRAGSQ